MVYPTTDMTLVQPRVAYDWHLAGRPWRIRLEFHGATDKGNDSAKFWEMYSMGRGNPIFINWGKIGSMGNGKPKSDKDFFAAKDVMESKLDKGYKVARGSVAVAPRSNPVDLTPAAASWLEQAWAVMDDLSGEFVLVTDKLVVLMVLTRDGAVDALKDPALRSRSAACSLVRAGL